MAHKIKCTVVKVVQDKTRSENPKDYQILQVTKRGEFVHQITGTVADLIDFNDNGLPAKGISLLNDTDKFMRMDKLIDTNEDNFDNYKIGKEVTVFSVPEVRNNQNKPETFFKVVHEDFKFDAEMHLAQLKDWDNRTWATGKELELEIKFRPFLSQRRNGLEYTVM